MPSKKVSVCNALHWMVTVNNGNGGSTGYITADYKTVLMRVSPEVFKRVVMAGVNNSLRLGRQGRGLSAILADCKFCHIGYTTVC